MHTAPTLRLKNGHADTHTAICRSPDSDWIATLDRSDDGDTLVEVYHATSIVKISAPHIDRWETPEMVIYRDPTAQLSNSELEYAYRCLE